MLGPGEDELQIVLLTAIPRQTSSELEVDGHTRRGNEHSRDPDEECQPNTPAQCKDAAWCRENTSADHPIRSDISELAHLRTVVGTHRLKMRKTALTTPMVLRESEVWYKSSPSATWVVASTEDDSSYFLRSSPPTGMALFSLRSDMLVETEGDRTKAVTGIGSLTGEKQAFERLWNGGNGKQSHGRT